MRQFRKLNRRSFVRTVLGSAAATASLALVGGRAQSQPVTDTDPSDPAGQGRGGRGGSGGVTDRDSGPGADPMGRGRGPASTGDSDSSDPAGYARYPDRRSYNDVSGSWIGSNGINYTFVQTADRFTWELDTGERGLGRVTGLYSATARWWGPNGDGEASADFRVDSENVVREIHWSNGIVLRRP